MLGLAVVAVAAAVAGGVCSTGVSVGIEAKWVQAFYGQDRNTLTSVNSRLRTFDLACQMLAPFTAGATCCSRTRDRLRNC